MKALVAKGTGCAFFGVVAHGGGAAGFQAIRAYLATFRGLVGVTLVALGPMGSRGGRGGTHGP